MKEEVAWDIERQLWTGGGVAYRRLVDPQCVMAFPAPGGLMRFDAIMASIDKMPRWSSVEMSDRMMTHPAKDVTVLAYKARGRREDEKPYDAFCTSTYWRSGEGWRLVQHQQSPA
jgi:hypothetical protein